MTATQVFVNYGTVIIEFLFELYVFSVMFAFRLKRKRHGVIRFALSSATVLTAAIAVSVFFTAFGRTPWGGWLVYFALFGLVLAQGIVVFDESVWTVLFCAAAAYAVQNLVYNLYLFQYFVGKLIGVYNFNGDALGIFLYRLMYYSVFAALATIMWFAAVKSINERLKMGTFNYKIFFVAVLILVVSVVLCSIEDIYFRRAGMGVEAYGFGADSIFALRLTSLVMNAVCCVATLVILSKTLSQSVLQRDAEQLRRAIIQSEQQYRISKDTIDMINIKCHDIKYKLDAAIKGGASPDAVEDLRRSIAIYDSNIETGNALLNVLFTEKSLYCEQHGIKLSCMIDGARLAFMDGGDLYCLFGNILDNALEAVTKIDDRERRVVDIVVKAAGDMVLVTAQNFFAGGVVIKDGLPITTKADKDYHGFGTESMRMIARKYGGEMIVDTQGDVFKLTMLFPTAQKTEESTLPSV